MVLTRNRNILAAKSNNSLTENPRNLGTDSYKRATLDVNRVLSEGVAARLNVMGFETDVAGRGPVNQNRWGIAPLRR